MAEPPPVACTLSEPELRERRAGLLRRVRERVVEVRPLAAPAPAGVAVRFAGDDEATVADVLELVRLESRCCAFLRFRVTLEPGNGPVILEISGPPGAAEILIGELAGATPARAGGSHPLRQAQPTSPSRERS